MARKRRSARATSEDRSSWIARGDDIPELEAWLGPASDIIPGQITLPHLPLLPILALAIPAAQIRPSHAAQLPE